MIKVVIVYKKNKISSKKYHYKHTKFFIILNSQKNALPLYCKWIERFCIASKKRPPINIIIVGLF